MSISKRTQVGLVCTAWVVLTISRAAAGILGSAHDFSEETWNTTGSACAACHTPHNAASGAAQIIPLWNHTTAAASGFTPYWSGSMNATPGQPAGVSLACLSCHDGTVAIDSYGGITGSHTISGAGLLSKDLSNDHPISFTYNSALATADGYLRNPAVATVDASVPGLGGKTISAALLKGPSSDQMECTSCHDPHRQKGTLATYPSSSTFVIIDGPKGSGYDKSLLCLTCHIK